MNESELYIDFAKRNFLILILPVILGLLLSIFFYAQEKPRIKASQSFRMIYNLSELNLTLALADEAVTELRYQRFSDLFPGSTLIVHKPGPLAITVDALSETKETSYALLLKSAQYLNENFSVGPMNQPEVIQVEPNLIKYIFSGLILGFLFGLTVALIKEYLHNF